MRDDVYRWETLNHSKCRITVHVGLYNYKYTPCIIESREHITLIVCNFDANVIRICTELSEVPNFRGKYGAK
mgnify:CR=1 FL=1